MKLFEGKFGRYVLPGVIMQSVLIGGGYATGREIIEYGGKYGANGWISGIAAFALFAVIAVISFELVRMSKRYDYKSLLKQIVGPGWIIYDILYVLLMFFIISVMASAAGEILAQTVNLNYWVGVIVLIAVVGLLNFSGSKLIERFETVGTVLLYAAYILFTLLVIFKLHGNIGETFATWDTSYEPGAGVWAAIATGIVYASYNLASCPAAFFTLRRQTKRREAVLSGIIGAGLMVVPWFLTYFAVMAFYPSTEVLDAPVPWLTMLQMVSGSPMLVILFGIVVGWTLIETATGIIHALLERVDTDLEELGKHRLKQSHRGWITAAILLGSALMARIGIIDLIGMGYQYMAYGFIIIYLLPLVTVGLYKFIRSGKAAGK